MPGTSIRHLPSSRNAGPRPNGQAAGSLCVLAGTVLLAAAALFGTLPASAADTVVTLGSLKISAPKDRLQLAASDSSIPFPPESGVGSPAVSGLTVTVYSAADPSGVPFYADWNLPGEREAWRLKRGKTRRWVYSARPGSGQALRRFSIDDRGRIKADAAGGSAALPNAAGPVVVFLGSLDWRLCARFEASDIQSFVAGESIVLAESTGSARLTGCTRPVFEGCGDGVLDEGEQCDDTNAEAGDGCSDTCTVEACGDGVLSPQEDCDDGNTADGDACPADCAICGSERVAGLEDCDPPYSVGGERLCGDDCRLAVCGDGTVEAGEDCERASGLDTACPGTCGTGGVLPCSCPGACGNGVVDGAEHCDPHAPTTEWTCSSDFGAVRCGLPNRGRPCSCCDDSCGHFGLGCCESASCVPSPSGFGTCVAPDRCLVDEACDEGFACDVSLGACCLESGNGSNPCRVLGVVTGVCCPGSTCPEGGGFQYCQ